MQVLDLFAGSGALGIEALSRGAAHATFVDQAKGALGSVRANLRELALEPRATVLSGDAVALAARHTPAAPAGSMPRAAGAPSMAGAAQMIAARLRSGASARRVSMPRATSTWPNAPTSRSTKARARGSFACRWPAVPTSSVSA
jgi:16S rRNA (guanine966-N2)-methyltransferase